MAPGIFKCLKTSLFVSLNILSFICPWGVGRPRGDLSRAAHRNSGSDQGTTQDRVQAMPGSTKYIAHGTHCTQLRDCTNRPQIITILSLLVTTE